MMSIDSQGSAFPGTGTGRIKEKFFPCTNSFLRSIAESMKPKIQLFAIKIQALYPFECNEGRPFKLDPKILAKELGYKSERSPQRLIASLVKEGVLERVGRKIDQLYRWVKKKVKKIGQKKDGQKEDKGFGEDNIPDVFGFSSVVSGSQHAAIAPIVEEGKKAVIASRQPAQPAKPKNPPTSDKYFGQWEDRRSNLGSDALVPNGPWKNEYGKLYPEFVDWAALRWIKDRPDQFPNGGNKSEMSRARANIKGHFSVKPKETEALTEMDYAKKCENLEKHWQEFHREFEDLKDNYRIREGVGIKEGELKRYASMALILEPESVVIEAPKTEPPSQLEMANWNEETIAKPVDTGQVIPTHNGQGDQGVSALDCSPKVPPKAPFKPRNKFLTSMRNMFEQKNEAREEAISQRREKLLAMGPEDPFLEHARSLAKQEGLDEVFDQHRRLIGFVEPAKNLEF